MDIQELSQNLGLEVDEYIEMLELFFESGGADLETLEAAIAAGELDKAHEASHSLKGSAGSLGLEGIFELAKTIDDKDRQGIKEGLDELIKELRKEYELLVDSFNKLSQE